MAGDRDFRKLEPVVQAELRRRAVAMVDAGQSQLAAAAAVGVNRRFVSKWLKARETSGDAGLEGGRRSGRCAGLSSGVLSGRDQINVAA